MNSFHGKTILVTGANRGIGRAFVVTLLKAGAGKILAAARKPETLNELVANGSGRVKAVRLDITDADQVSAAAADHADVDILINNAGTAALAGFIQADTVEAARADMETNYFGTLNMVRAFAPVLARNGGGLIVNIASIASHVNFPLLGSYSASKAAVHSLTQAVRAELGQSGTKVVGVYPGPVDTDMARALDIDKTSPEDIVAAVLQGIATGNEDIYPDAQAIELHSGLLADPKAVERQVGQMLPH